MQEADSGPFQGQIENRAPRALRITGTMHTRWHLCDCFRAFEWPILYVRQSGRWRIAEQRLTRLAPR
jgi:hypothetical protein